MAKDCIEPNIPTVDNEACECQDGIHSSDCINLAEMNSYLNLPAGASLTKVIDRISKKIKSNSIESNKNKRSYKTVELILTQQGALAPTAIEVIKEIAAQINITYISQGNYLITSTNEFVGDVTVYVGTFDRDYGEEVKAYKVDDSNISIRTGVDNNFDTDGVLDLTPITIKIPV